MHPINGIEFVLDGNQPAQLSIYARVINAVTRNYIIHATFPL
jgi:hypothetical protein